MKYDKYIHSCLYKGLSQACADCFQSLYMWRPNWSLCRPSTGADSSSWLTFSSPPSWFQPTPWQLLPSASHAWLWHQTLQVYTPITLPVSLTTLHSSQGCAGSIAVQLLRRASPRRRPITSHRTHTLECFPQKIFQIWAASFSCYMTSPKLALGGFCSLFKGLSSSNSKGQPWPCCVGAMLCLAFVHNILRRHRACNVLVNRAVKEDATTQAADPYIDIENDPSKSRALESSLWEVKSLCDHYYVQVHPPYHHLHNQSFSDSFILNWGAKYLENPYDVTCRVHSCKPIHHRSAFDAVKKWCEGNEPFSETKY